MSLTEDGVKMDVKPNEVNLDWVFWDSQLDAIDAVHGGDHDVVVFRGGYGSGKTVLGSRLTIEVATQVPHSDCLILAQDFAKGGATTFKGFFKQLPGDDTIPEEGGDPENSPFVEDYNRVKKRLTWFNGAVVRLGSADKWNRYAGAEFNFVWCDEVAHYENTDLYKLYEMLISRQRTRNGPNVTLWTSTGNGYNQFYDFVKRKVDADDNPLPARIKNVVADSRDNPFLAEQDKLARQFAGTSREDEALSGGFAAAQGLVYDVERGQHIVTKDALGDTLPSLDEDYRVYGYDAGWHDPRVVLELRRTVGDGHLVVWDEFYASKTHLNEDVLPWLNGRTKGTMACEHEPTDIDRLKSAGWPTVKAIKDIEPGISEVSSRFNPDEGPPRLYVVDDCVNTVQELLTYQEDHIGANGAPDHAMDALRYAVMAVAEGQDGGVSTGSISIGNNEPDRNPNGLPGLGRR